MPNTLFIKTDISHRGWLEYILSEFIRIQSFNAAILIMGLEDPLPEQAHVLYYSTEVHGHINLYNCQQVLPATDILQVELELFLIQASSTEDTRFYYPFDLFWNAFVFLSRLEEYLSVQKNKKIHSHCILHPRSDKASFAIPVVNVLFSKLEQLIRKEFPQLSFGEGAKPVIELAHDVDYLFKTFPFMAKQTILNLYDVYRTLNHPQDCLKTLQKTVEFLFRRQSYWTFEYWEELEKKLNVRSIFYVHAKVRRNLLTWLVDPNYDLEHYPRLQEKLKQLSADGFAIGLHGSYYSAVDLDLLKREKEVLEGVLGKPVSQTRQHWLRYVEGKTPFIHDAVFRMDSTLGWNDRVGFRNGCSSAFYPYDHVHQRAFTFLEIPQVIMDFNIYQSLSLENMEFVNRAVQVLERALKYKSAYVSISWHDRACTRDYNWHKTYEYIVKGFVVPLSAGKPDR